ncbi:MAG: hypothetical protein M9924_21290 [Rhizobiaceae bacterium]|nr:hypothetical protein [Rhizobiaceae bacterium]
MTNWTTLTPTKKADAIKAVWRPGLSARRIGEKLGITRNAVIGVYTRCSDQLTGHPLRATVRTISRVKGLKSTNRRGKPKAQGRNDSAPFPATRPERPKPANPQNAARAPLEAPTTPLVLFLADLGSHQRKWPFGDPRSPDSGFCGQPRQLASPYCEHHHRMAYQPVADRYAA